MAERFGGKYSPDPPDGQPPGQTSWDGARRTRAGFRVNLMFLLPLPLALRAFALGGTGMFASLVALGLLLAAAWLTREGELAQEAYESRKVARRPAFPRKIVGSLLTGLGLAVAAVPGGTMAVPVGLGVLGAALHLLSFGPDPLKDKGMEGVDTYAQDRAARAVEGGESYLAAMKDAILRTRDRTLEARVDSFAATARKMFRQVEEDPRDLVGSKKYLTVYLMGARDATAKFADLYAKGRDPRVRADYEALLGDLENSFTTQTQALLTDNRADLDVEISVLRERLQREGVRT